MRFALALAACGGLSSCGMLMRVKMPTVAEERAETELTPREKGHLAAALDRMAANWTSLNVGNAAARAQAKVAYDRALANFLQEWDRHQSPRYWQSGTVFASKTDSFQIDFDTKARPEREVQPAQLDQIKIATRARSQSDDTLSERFGAGLPIVGQVRGTAAARKAQPYLPPNGGNMTLTAVMEMTADDGNPATPRRCRLHFYNTLNVEKAQVEGRELTLAANYTASKDLALSKKSLSLFGWLGLLYPERALDDSRLYVMDGYDPKRIPVVFVHGLMSDPHIWLNAVNAISSDPELRAKYQPWYFLYPSGMSVPQSAARLRHSLQQARDYFDPDHNDPGMNRMVLVGHSMGGLVSRMQAIDPGDKLWDAIFSKPPEALNVSDSVRERLLLGLKFKPDPEVKRLIFIATPQHGSQLAGRDIVRKLSSLIRLPVDTLLMSKQLLSGNTDALSPQIREWGVFSFLSLGTLSSKHPFYKGLNAVPIPVPYHSIIGQLGHGKLEDSSDGAVPYWSSHLDGARSEKVYPCWHGCVQRPEVVGEVKRILKEHLREGK